MRCILLLGATDRDGPFVSDSDVERVVSALKLQGPPRYTQDFAEPAGGGDSNIEPDGDELSDEALYAQAVALVVREKRVSIGQLQRWLRIGYNRAQRVLDMLEEGGVITPSDKKGRRYVN